MRRWSAVVCLLAGLCLLLPCAAVVPDIRTVEELREEYPLYDHDFPPLVDGVRLPMGPRLGALETLAFATVTSDTKLVSIETGAPVDDPAFAEKYPDSTTAKLYVYSVRIDEMVAGNVSDREYWIYHHEFDLYDYIRPKTGDRLLFALLDKSTEPGEKLHHAKAMSQMPVIMGMPLFYRTDGDVILSILNDETMKAYDGMGKTQFVQSLRELRAGR